MKKINYYFLIATSILLMSCKSLVDKSMQKMKFEDLHSLSGTYTFFKIIEYENEITSEISIPYKDNPTKIILELIDTPSNLEQANNDTIKFKFHAFRSDCDESGIFSFTDVSKNEISLNSYKVNFSNCLNPIGFPHEMIEIIFMKNHGSNLYFDKSTQKYILQIVGLFNSKHIYQKI